MKKYYIKIIFYLISIFIVSTNLYSSQNNDNIIKFVRPVSNKVKLIQKMGLYKLENKNLVFSYEYKYKPELNDFNIMSINGMSKGKVLDSWIDKDFGFLPEKWKNFFVIEDVEKKDIKEGGIIIDYGDYEVKNFDSIVVNNELYKSIENKNGKAKILAKISNVIPLVKKGDKINKKTKIAKFAEKERFGYDPIVSIQFILVDTETNTLLSHLNLLKNDEF